MYLRKFRTMNYYYQMQAAIKYKLGDTLADQKFYQTVNF